MYQKVDFFSFFNAYREKRDVLDETQKWEKSTFFSQQNIFLQSLNKMENRDQIESYS
jgi:hypothetical protein